VEVIGWLYQYYNSEPKDKVFAKFKKNKKAEKSEIPAATQFYTTRWIVQYMVENTLGRLWLETSPHIEKDKLFNYYIPSVDQSLTHDQQIVKNKKVDIENITIIDPCVGSGHILLYAFDILYEMYSEVGYLANDIPKLIIENNLYGLDIDDRAIQMASFALLMKAREKSRRVFRQKI